MELTQEQITELNKHQYQTFEVKGTEKLKAERAIIHYITTPDIDVVRDIVDPKGGDLEDFKQKRTVFYNHNYNNPIAKNVDLRVTNEGIKAKTVFPKTTQLADDIYNLHIEGVINSWSIGFDIPRDRKGMIVSGAVTFDEEKNIRTFNKWKLLEYSSAPLPANSSALDLAKGIVKSAEAMSEIHTLENEGKEKEEINHSAEFEEIKNLIKDLKDATQGQIKEINEEISNLKNRNVNKTQTVVVDREKLIKEAIKRELSKVTGRKY